MTDEIDAQGYRANVGIVLMQPDGHVFLGRRAGGKGWQFPQGGIQSGETLEQAIYRELREEIGLEPEHVEIIGMTQRWLRYRLPDRYISREQLPLCLGEKQRWFLLRGRDEQPPVRFDHTNQPEFSEWRWAAFWEPVREVTHFKRKVYRRALQELGELAFPQGLPPYPEWWSQR
jgi:putative (di)nucleoside polyphosphate hydrolase